MTSNVRSPSPLTRRRAANRIRRLRGELSREAFVALLRSCGVDVSVRSLGDIERGLVRMTALEIVEAIDSQTRNGEAVPARQHGPSLIRCDMNVLPAARSCGAKATHQAAAADDGEVVRPTAGVQSKRAA